MSLWLWMLIVPAAAGLVAAIAGSTIAVIGIVRLQRRLTALGQSSFVTKVESLQIQAARLTRISGDVNDLQRRAEAAIESLRRTPEAAGATNIRDAWAQCAAQFRTIVQELS
jgi:hypothetical protein